MTQKNRMFAMRITEQDLAAIKIKAAKAKLNTTEYITRSALDKSIVVVEGLDKVVVELKAIGRNLNQLVTLCNMGKITCSDLSEVKQSFGTVFDYLYDLMDRK